MASGSMNGSTPPNQDAHAAHTNGHLTSPSHKATESTNPASSPDSVVSTMNDPSKLERSSSSPVERLARGQQNGITQADSSDAADATDKATSAATESNGDTPMMFQFDGAGDDRPDPRRASKRKAAVDEDEFIASNPELYGLRRSARARPARRMVESSTDENEGDTDASAMVTSKSRKRNKKATSRKVSKRATPSNDDDYASRSESETNRRDRRRSGGKKKSNNTNHNSNNVKLSAAVARALSRAEGRSSTRRATKIQNYNEDDQDPFSEEESELQTPSYGVDAAQDDRPGIDVVLNYRPQDGQSIDPDNVSRNEFEYFIKWQGQAHYHATWETPSSLATCRGFRRLENYFRKTVLEDIRIANDSDVPPEEKERWNLDRERDVDALNDHMKVDRVIGTQEGEAGAEYYVKWKALNYDSCTWERAELLGRIAQGEIDHFLDRTSRVPVSNKHESNLATRSPHKPIREQPSYIKHGELRDFQITGLNFLAYNWCKGNNVILADEMGLGKTVQTVAFINWLRHDRQQEGPFIIVVPLSTIPAWTETFNNWTPDVNFVVYNGNEAARKTIRDYEMSADGTWKKLKFTVLLTTYEYILHDATILSQIKWQFMAVDEAHRLKNRESQLYARLLEMRAPGRLLITGTPMQNTLGELSALMDFLMPGTVKIDDNLSLQDEAAGEVIAELTKAIKPYILRRTKMKVENDLPPKSEKTIRVELADVQRTHYKNIITRNYAALNQGGKGPKQSLLNIVMELRKASNHPFMFENVKERILGGSDRREDLLKGLITSSGKMMLLDRLLTKLKRDNHRVLIFSQMVKMLDILSEYLYLRGYQFQRLDGTIASGPRRMAIDHFNAPESNDFCFLLSTRAGGLGINLMTADTVILFDADWNPHADLQAMARAHRIGQKKPVTVYRFVSKDSIEEDVLKRAQDKLILEWITIQRGVSDESSKQYSDLMAKASANVSEPTTSEAISRLLKHRSQKMFEESSTQRKLEELDIDAVLEGAEEHKVEGPTGLEADGGEEFLKSFNYMDVKIDPEWDEIIPKDELSALQAEAKKEDDERYLNEVIEQNAPRKRKAPTDERQERANKRAREMEAAEEAKEETVDSSSEEEDDDPSRPLAEKELRNLFRAFLRYGALDDRTTEILTDAHLVGRDMSLLKQAVSDITGLSKRLLEEEHERVRKLEAATQKTLTKKDKKAVLFDYKGVKRLNAETILDRPGEMSLLKDVIGGLTDDTKFRLPAASKAAHYSCAWGAREDGMLLVGILRHGYGAWSTIRDDVGLGMADKLFLEEQRVDKKEERERAADKAAKSPGAVHLVRRADYLLSILKEGRSGKAKAADLGRSEAGPARPNLKRKSGADSSERTRSKRPRSADAPSSGVGAGSDFDEDEALGVLFEPVSRSLRLVRTATKEGLPSKSERAKILRRELLGIGHHISTLVKSVEGGASLQGKFWAHASKYWPNPDTPGNNLKSMYDRLVAAEEATGDSAK